MTECPYRSCVDPSIGLSNSARDEGFRRFEWCTGSFTPSPTFRFFLIFLPGEVAPRPPTRSGRGLFFFLVVSPRKLRGRPFSPANAEIRTPFSGLAAMAWNEMRSDSIRLSFWSDGWEPVISRGTPHN